MSEKMSQAQIDELLRQMQSGAFIEEVSKLSGDEYICLNCHRIAGISTYKGINKKDIIYLNGCKIGLKHRYINITFLKEFLKKEKLI